MGMIPFALAVTLQTQPRGPHSADFNSLCIGRRIIFLLNVSFCFGLVFCFCFGFCFVLVGFFLLLFGLANWVPSGFSPHSGLGQN